MRYSRCAADGRPGIIDRLPAEARERVGQLRSDGSTRDEIRAELEREFGIRIARSTMGDWLKRFDQVHDRLKHTRAASEALIARLGDAPEHHLGRLNVEIVHGLIVDLLASVGAGEPLGPREIKDIASALATLARASKTDADRELALRREFAEQAADQAETAARGEGLSDDALARIRTTILGMAASPSPAK